MRAACSCLHEAAAEICDRLEPRWTYTRASAKNRLNRLPALDCPVLDAADLSKQQLHREIDWERLDATAIAPARTGRAAEALAAAPSMEQQAPATFRSLLRAARVDAIRGRSDGRGDHAARSGRA